MPDDYVAQIQQFFLSDFYGIPIWFLLVALVIGFLIYMMFKNRKPSDKPPPLVEPEKEITKEIKTTLKTTGVNIRYKSFLMTGMIRIGRIMSWSPYHFERTTKIKNDVDIKNIKIPQDDKEFAEIVKDLKGYKIKIEHHTFFLYKVIGTTIFHLLYYIFCLNFFNLANERFFLVDKEYIDETEGNNIFIQLDAQPKQFYKNIYIFSSKGQNVIQGMVNHLTVKTLLKENVNFIPQMHYFDFKTGRFAGKLREIGDARSKAWQRKSQNKDTMNDDIQTVESDE